MAKASRFRICAVEATRLRYPSDGYPSSRLQPARDPRPSHPSLPNQTKTARFCRAVCSVRNLSYSPLPKRRDHHPARRGWVSPDAGAADSSGAGVGGWGSLGSADDVATGWGSVRKLTFSRTVERRGTALSASRRLSAARRSSSSAAVRPDSSWSRSAGCGSLGAVKASGWTAGAEGGVTSSKSATALDTSDGGAGASSSAIEPARPSSGPPRRRRPPRRPRRRGRRSPVA